MMNQTNKSSGRRSPRAFFKENISFRLAPRKWIRLLALAVTVFMLLFVLRYRNLYLQEGNAYGAAVLAFSLLAAPLAGFFIGVRVTTNDKMTLPYYTVIFFLMPIASMQMVETFNGKFIYNFSVPTFLLNYAVYLFFYLLVYLFSGRYHLSGLVVNIALYVLAMLNYWVDLFRGTPFLPTDISTFGTGMEVADGYTYELTWQLITASILMFLIYLLNKEMKNVRPFFRASRVLARVLSAIYVLVVLFILFCTSFLANRGYKPDFWDQSRGYHNTGTLFNFCLNLKYLHISKPEGYDVTKLSDLIDREVSKYETDGDSSTSVSLLTGKDTYKAGTATPNVICIMNESLADLGTLGDLKTNKDYMPFIHSLTRNTIKGTLQVPVFGAGTSNTEYEFLSGDSISYLPAGSNVYQSYIKEDDHMPTLVSNMKQLGYSATAFHPYYASGWNRINVYKNFGFPRYVSIEDFVDADILNTYKKNNDSYEYEQLLKERYPNRNMLLRRFVSDSYDFRMVESMYRKRDTSKPFFLFNVTMQNHGGYAMDYDNFKKGISIRRPAGNYEKATRYLSLIKYSDSAFKQLVQYFQKVKEPTIICMFGDHQPAVEDSFYESLYGTDLDSLSTEQTQQRYTTPFVIWANYDIPEETLDKISANYLSTLVSQLAGLPQTPYQKFLAAMYQELPVLDSVGYMDRSGRYYSYNDKTNYSGLIADYRCLEYNHLIDRKNRQTSLFTLTDSTAGTSGN